MINGAEYLYGREDYEGTYCEGESNRRPLHEALGYRCIGDMLQAQKEYAKRRAGRPIDDFEVLA